MNLGDLYRREYGPILATLIRVVRDFTLAEDAVQEAFATAQAAWSDAGAVPANPAAWILTTARHKAIDQIRRRTLATRKIEELAVLAATPESAPVPQDSLRLIFTCCHPALALEAQVALTLRTIGGLTTEEIARAFLVPAATMAQRLVRAKAKIKAAGIPYAVPADDRLEERLAGALAVLYLIFNEGYLASGGPHLLRTDLSAEAIRLARQLAQLLPAAREVRGLLALMLLTEARRPARTDAAGDIVLLEDQDRSRWDARLIAAGQALVPGALGGGPPGRYAVQAAIAALHAEAPAMAATDWPQIAGLYAVLQQLDPSPIVALNRAVAVAMAEDCERGLALLAPLDLPGYHRLPAARADLLRRLGRCTAAAGQYRAALALVTNDAERRFLVRRLQEMERAAAP